MIGFVEAVQRFFLRAFDFKSRATRAEYWWVILFTALVFFCIFVLAAFIFPVFDGPAGGEPEEPSTVFLILYVIMILLFAIPSISILVRRLHDINASGWWAILGALQAIPLLGLIISLGILVVALIPGTPGPNRFGDPSVPSGHHPADS